MGFGSFFGDQTKWGKKKYGYNYNKPKNTGVTVKPKADTKYTFNNPAFKKQEPPPEPTQGIDNLAPPPPPPLHTYEPPEPPPEPYTQPPAPYTPDQNLQNVIDQSNIPQNTDILSTLAPGQQEQVNKNIADSLSGRLAAPQMAAGRQAFAAAAQNLRRLGGAQNAGNIGQGGAALKGAQATEQGIMGALANQQLLEQQQMAEQKAAGTDMATGLAKSKADYNIKEKMLASDEKMKALGIMSDEKMKTLGIASDEKMKALGIMSDEKMQIASNQLKAKIAEESNWLEQQGINQENAKLYGYTDPSGNHVKGELEMKAEEFQSGLKSEGGEAFASYVSANPNANYNDPAVQKTGQALWESLGNEGQAPKWWVEQRIAALRDPALTNPIVGTMEIFKEALEAGAITQEQFEKAMGEFTETITGSNIEGDGEEPKDLTPKEVYGNFKTDYVPEEDQDWYTQSVHEEMGSPDTWEDVKKQLGEVGKIYSEEGSGKVLNVGKNLSPQEMAKVPLSLKEGDIKTIADAIEKGDEYAIAKFGVPKDSNIHTFISAVNESASGTSGMFGHHMKGVGKEPILITKSDVDPYIGKVVSFVNNKGETKTVAITGYDESSGHGSVFQRILYKDLDPKAESGGNAIMFVS